jgi:hypothetical protein
MPNGDIALPFCMAFVVKKLDNFDVKSQTVDTKMTQILYIKFTGLHDIIGIPKMKRVMAWCAEQGRLDIKVNEI